MSMAQARAPRAGMDLFGYSIISLGMFLSLALTTIGGWVIGLPFRPEGAGLLSFNPISAFAALACAFMNLMTWAILRSAAKNFAYWKSISAGARAWCLVALLLGAGGIFGCWLADIRAAELATSMLANTGEAEDEVENEFKAEKETARSAWEDRRLAERTAREDVERAQGLLDEIKDIKTNYEGLPLRLREAFQQRLATAGYSPGRIDGAWGPNTQNAATQYQQELEASLRAARGRFTAAQALTVEAKLEFDEKSEVVRNNAGDSIEKQASEILENQGGVYIVYALAAFIEIGASLGTFLLKFAGAREPTIPRRRRNRAGYYGGEVGPVTRGDPLDTPLTREEVDVPRPRDSAEPALSSTQLRNMARAATDQEDPVAGGVRMFSKARMRNGVRSRFDEDRAHELEQQHAAAEAYFMEQQERRRPQ